MTRNEARKHFADSGLTFADIRKDHIRDLQAIIQKHLDQRNERYADTKMYVNKPHKRADFTSGGILRQCQLTMRCHYFSYREAISFDKGGFIGFAGWADDPNVNPVIDAFVEWVDAITGKDGRDTNAEENKPKP